MSTSTLRVLLYHRLEQPGAVRADLAPDLVSASPGTFDKHMKHLTRFYHPIDAGELLAALSAGHRLPSRAVLVTFDDAYRDFQSLAWPILRQHRVPAVLFAPTAFVEQPMRTFWWDQLWQVISRTRKTRAMLPGQATPVPLAPHDPGQAWDVISEWLKQRTPGERAAALDHLATQLEVTPDPTHAVLNWAELRDMAADGLAVASHSRTHELLDQLDEPDLRGEVFGSRDDLVRALGASPPLFAYPNGNFNRRTVDSLAAAGFWTGLTTVHGLNTLRSTQPLLRRDAAGVPMHRFVTNLLGPVARLRRALHPLAY